ncbi:MAG: isoprenylcysteine carboxylmethyltransferase family protein [Spirochaetia bacterium]|nr:isoprenylcysteine carboxylmethyltransferase family protein [Spirochaetia bacterium]
MVINIIIFAFFSIIFIYVSWPYLRKFSSRGFYRFFVFESILILILINSKYWFENPFSLFQILSWILLSVSVILVITAVYNLHKKGAPVKGIETTTKLVDRAVYKYIRHPMYASLFYLCWGSFLKNISILGAMLTFGVTILLGLIAKIEEKENIEKFGDSYLDYMKKSKRLLPFVY